MSRTLFIAAPTHHGLTHAAYTRSLVALCGSLGDLGFTGYRYESLDSADVAEQRDLLAHAFRLSDCEELLFVDSDMAFRPSLLRELRVFDKEVIGAVYTKREFGFPAMKRALEQGSSFEDARRAGYSFILHGCRNVEPLCHAEGIGLGFTLIKRSAIEKLAASDQVRKYPSRLRPGTTLVGLFQRIEDPFGAVLPEDISFCHRWRKLGGTVWAYAAAEIGHVGPMIYGAPLLPRDN